MGASEWRHFTPYQPDISKALGELQVKVFEAGEYYRPQEWTMYLYEHGIITEAELNERLREANAEPKPKTIDELIKLRGHEGTHSILDVTAIATVHDDNAISPLTVDHCLRIFGTAQPTHAIIEQHADRLSQELLDLMDYRGGIYVIVYSEGIPAEIYFAGYSGD